MNYTREQLQKEIDELASKYSPHVSAYRCRCRDDISPAERSAELYRKTRLSALITVKYIIESIPILDKNGVNPKYRYWNAVKTEIEFDLLPF